MIEPRNRILGCILGGAAGDALGAPIEFARLAEIRARFGAEGLTEHVAAYGRLGAVTDDTQMTLFTAEGLLRAHVRRQKIGDADPVVLVLAAYLRWLATQGETSRHALFREGAAADGWLIRHEALFSRRGPGTTCLSALISASDDLSARNDSKGCGTVMRVAPVGLVCRLEEAFSLGVDVSRLTHGHPSGYLAGGYFAALLAHLMQGSPIDEAIARARRPLESSAGAAEVLGAIDRAQDLAASGEPTAERVESLGGGWVAEEAVAIALYCALVARDFVHGVRLAVNHSGDSDSTGLLAGNLLGVVGGIEVVPSSWLDILELRDVLERVALDLAAMRAGALDVESAAARYPGW